MKEVTELSNNPSVAEFPCIQGPILKVFPKALPKLIIGLESALVVSDVIEKVSIYSL
jgi:hypothetical protein